VQWGTEYDEREDGLHVEVSPESVPEREMMRFFFTDVTETAGTCVLYGAETRVAFEVEGAGR